MTEIENALKEAGVKVQELTNDAREKLDAYLKDYKSKLDTETRRKTRAFWGSLGFLAGAIVGVGLDKLFG